MKKFYEKPMVEVVDFQNETVMTDDEVVFSMTGSYGSEDVGEY